MGTNEGGTAFHLHGRRADDQSRSTVPQQHIAPHGVSCSPRMAQGGGATGGVGEREKAEPAPSQTGPEFKF